MPVRTMVSRERSKQLWERAKGPLAGGVSSAFRARAVPHPLYFESGRGPRLTDVDGNTYIDYTLAWGPLILGHAHPAVERAVAEQLSRGWIYGAQLEGEVRVAQKIVDLVPCADQVCFCSSGTEAVQVAFRIARGYSGRSRIVRFEGHYHGWIEPSPGTLTLPWNDIAAVEKAVAEYGKEIAAIITEPILCNGGCILPGPGYLQALREITAQHGIVLIFDEVITGFRVALGGAQQRYSVTPDLATFGKAVAAGFPLSVVAGRGEIMEVVASGKVLHGGTFNGNPVVLAAAEAALEELSRDGGAALQRAAEFGHLARRGLEAAAQRHGIPLTVRGVETVFRLTFGDEGPVTDSRGLTAPASGRLGAFLAAALDAGLYLLPDGRWYISTVHGERELDETLAAADQALSALRNG
ncbi:MAG TPA: aminotransferase class III-fold pyridoxal phosphate-dependent enzyme [Bryobacterales bacterium]|nr:aminotransferase class III-fold pyridoxal phosphate-dependent enzyme [Bryobacterales bacterium]